MLVSKLPHLLRNPSCLPVTLEYTFTKTWFPKGYIGAIETRLHQAEAALEIILSPADGLDGSLGPGDPGASSLIEDLCRVHSLFNNQIPSSPPCANKSSISVSTCSFYPLRRVDALRLKVEG